MATIQISDEMIPKGYEATGEFRVPNKGEAWLCVRGVASTGLQEITPRVILRRIPRLKQIVFTVASNEPRVIYPNEWFVASNGLGVLQALGSGFSEPRLPLTREEVWE